MHAVEADPAALSWARRNVEAHAAAGGTPVALHAADVRWPDLLPDLETHVDLVLCNPPYVPDGTPVPPEVASFDPPGAVFGGPDGLEIIRAVVSAAAALLRHGGRLGIEHDDTHGDAVPDAAAPPPGAGRRGGAPRPGGPPALRHRPARRPELSERGVRYVRPYPTPRSLLAGIACRA